MVATKNREVLFQLLTGVIFIILAFLCIYPFYYLFIASMSDANAVRRGIITWRPVDFTLDYFNTAFNLPGIAGAILISVVRTVTGTAVTVFMCSMVAYSMTKHNYPGRKIIYRFMVMTLYVSGGLIPWFVTMQRLGLNNNFLLYILPTAVSVYYTVLIKTFMESIPASLEESALIDGAGYFRIFLQIMIPLSVPIIAAITVFAAVAHWNEWMSNFLLVSNPKLQTLQKVLMDFLRQSEVIAQAAERDDRIMGALGGRKLSPQTIRTSVSVITVLPILCVYPFMQRYFVKGLMIGAIKG